MVMQKVNDQPRLNWLLLRGLTRESRHWGGFVFQLQQQFPSANIITIDLPGNGEFNRLKSPLSMHRYVEFARAEINKLSLQGPLYIVGLSLGGMVATDWARRYADEVAGLVLLNCSMRGLCPYYQRFSPRHYWPIVRALCRGRQAREQLILDMTSTEHVEDFALLQRWQEIAADKPVGVMNFIRQLLAAARFSLPEEAPAQPVLLMRAERDALVNPRCTARLARLWHVPMLTHSTAGHDLALDAPEWTCKHIAHWFNGL